jgi:hypothetical protein
MTITAMIPIHFGIRNADFRFLETDSEGNTLITLFTYFNTKSKFEDSKSGYLIALTLASSIFVVIVRRSASQSVALQRQLSVATLIENIIEQPSQPNSRLSQPSSYYRESGCHVFV